MPTSLEARSYLLDNDILFLPGKAANAGGVAVSGLEQSQNSMRVSWSREHVDENLQTIMRDIHGKCVEHGSENGSVNYVVGSNVAGLSHIAKSICAYGLL